MSDEALDAIRELYREWRQHKSAGDDQRAAEVDARIIAALRVALLGQLARPFQG